MHGEKHPETTGKTSIWVLGATGFIGRALLEVLATGPGHSIHLLIHKTAPYRQLEAFNTFSGSLGTLDPGWLKRYPPDVVFHMARLGGRRGILRKWAAHQGEKANRRLLQILASLEKPPVVVYVSGSLMYGPQDGHAAASEESPLAPAAFARYYHRAERPWLEAQQAGKLDVRFARPGWVVGPGSWFDQCFYQPMRATAKVPCFGGGQQLMSLVHLDDCARLISALGFHGRPGQNLNIFAGKPLTQAHFASLLADLSGLPLRHFSLRETEKILGKTVAQALTTSIPLQTIHPDLYRHAALRFSGHRELLAHVLGLLEHKQGILSQAP